MADIVSDKRPKITLKTAGLSVAKPTAQFTVEREFTIEELRRESIALIYGESGMGKTTLARSWTPNPLFLLFRGGNEHMPSPLLNRKIAWIDILYKAQLDAAVMEMQKDLIESKTVPKEFRGIPVESIIFDQLSSWHNLQSTDLLVNTARERENSETMAQNDWGQARKRMHITVSDVNRIPVHKLYLAIARTITDAKQNPLRIEPYVPGQLVEDFMQFSDFVFFLTTKRISTGPGQMKTIRVIHTQPGEHVIEGKAIPYLAKDSTGKLPQFIDVPDPEFPLFEAIMSYLK